MPIRAGSIVVLSLALAGCAANNAPPEPEPDVPAPVAERPAPKPEPIVEVLFDAPRPGEIALPIGGGQWPWDLAAASTPRPTKNVTITEVDDFITGLAVRPSADRAVVTIKSGNRKKVGEKEKTRVLWCDTAAGTLLAEWEIKGPWIACDVSPDGKRFLARQNESNESNEILGIWTIADDLSLKRKSIEAHSAIGPAGALTTGAQSSIASRDRDVVWAAFVDDRIVSSSKTGQLRVFDADSYQQLGTIDGVPGRPTVAPDGKKVLFLSEAGVALLDPATAKIVGVRPIGITPDPAALAVTPDGKLLAIGGHDKMRFLDLVTGEWWDGHFPKANHSTPHVPNSFGWASDKYLFADHFLYRPDTPIPVWDYGGVGDARCIGRQTWVLVKWPDAVATLRAFELPHPTVAGKLPTEFVKEGLYLLRPGDGIRVSVAGIPPNKRDEVQVDLEKRLRQIGYRIDQKGIATAVASLDEVREVLQTYQGYKPIPYSRQPARLKLVKDDKVLWEEAWASDPPSFTFVPRKANLTEFVQGHGAPEWTIYSKARIPAMILGPKQPLFAFGRSELYPDRIKDLR